MIIGDFFPFHFDHREWLNYFQRPIGKSICVEYNDNEMIGKTVDYVDITPSNRYTFIGFTDGTYAFQVYCDINPFRTTAHNYQPNMGWEYQTVPPFSLLFDYKTDKDNNITFTPTHIGEWFINKSKVNMTELIEKLEKAAEEESERNREYQKERDLEEYQRLKEKLGMNNGTDCI